MEKIKKDKIKWKGEDLLALYADLTEEIRTYKDRQLAYANLGIILNGSLIAFEIAYGAYIGGCLIVILSLMVAIYGTYTIDSFQRTMSEKRVILEKLYEKFSDDFRTCRGKAEANYTSRWFHYSTFAVPLIVCFWIGFLANLLIVCFLSEICKC